MLPPLLLLSMFAACDSTAKEASEGDVVPIDISASGKRFHVDLFAQLVSDLDGDDIPDVVAFDLERGPTLMTGGPDVYSRLDGAWTVLDPAPDLSLFGFQINAGADVTGDGQGDVVVGGTNAETGEPVAEVYTLAGGVPARIASLTGLSDEVHTFMGGFSVPVGDVSGDGYTDLLFGDLSEDRENVTLGLLEGPINGDLTYDDAVATVPALRAADELSTVSAGGDVTGDGTDDFAVHYTQTDTLIFDYAGFATGDASEAYATFTGETIDGDDYSYPYSDRLGLSAVVSEDLDGDGRADVVLGAPWAGPARDYTGATCMWTNVSRGTYDVAMAERSIAGENAYAESGAALATAGTFGGLLVGGVGADGDYEVPEQPRGRVSLLTHPLTTPTTRQADLAYLLPERTLGPHALLSSADIDADGQTDILFVSPLGTEAWLLPGAVIATDMP